MSKKAGRPKTYYDVDEVKEIIDLKLRSMDYDYNKLTYNSVFKFNQYLVTSKIKNNKGNLFKLYGYSFWAAEYKDKPNFGKDQIDLAKQQSLPIIAGEFFEADVADIEVIVDTYIDNPKKMKNLLSKLFIKERKSNAHNDIQFYDMQKDLNKYKELAERYKKTLFTLFYSGQYFENTFPDLINLAENNNPYVIDEIFNIFNNQNSLHCEQINIKDSNLTVEKNILNLAELFKNKN